MVRKEVYITQNNDEEIIVLSANNLLSNGNYQDRVATEAGYAEYMRYFRNIEICCDSFIFHCEEEKYRDSCHFMTYDRRIRKFSVGVYVISCCPFCGKRFPKELGLEWIHLVEEQFGEKYLSPPKMYELPQEWLTDEWWVKRGL